MQTVNSGWIEAIDYDESTRELSVETKFGATYRYQNVPPTAYRDLMAADSKGSHVNAHIKPHFSVRKS